MKVVLFGATGMIGQGVLRECLLADDVERVLVIGRAPTEREHVKLSEIVHKDLSDLSAFEGELTGYDACFYCAGVSSVGMSEADYTDVTYDTPVASPCSSVSTSRAIALVMMRSFPVASAGGISTDGEEKFEWVEQPRPHWPQ